MPVPLRERAALWLRSRSLVSRSEIGCCCVRVGFYGANAQGSVSRTQDAGRRTTRDWVGAGRRAFLSPGARTPGALTEYAPLPEWKRRRRPKRGGPFPDRHRWGAGAGLLCVCRSRRLRTENTRPTGSSWRLGVKAGTALPGRKRRNRCRGTKGGRSPHRLFSAGSVFKAHPGPPRHMPVPLSSTLVSLPRSPGVQRGYLRFRARWSGSRF